MRHKNKLLKQHFMQAKSKHKQTWEEGSLTGNPIIEVSLKSCKNKTLNYILCLDIIAFSLIFSYGVNRILRFKHIIQPFVIS